MTLVNVPNPERPDYWDTVLLIASRPILAYWSACFVAGVLIAGFTGNNRVSMHSFYRNRLIRCYLAASAKKKDCSAKCAQFDMPLQWLGGLGDTDKHTGGPRYCGPYPLFNASLNVVNGGELAWQERKACSFLLSPKYSGFDSAGAIANEAYRASAAYGYNGHEMCLGQAMAISGAALSPYMGRYSSRILAFLFGILNFRLGWWLPHPKWPASDDVASCNRLLTSIRELSGRITHKSDHIYLSDGGHFDNLGIYQLIKRGCRIVVCFDATADPELACEDMANCMEKCRVDLGVEIECDPSTFVSRRDRCWMVGQIRYERAGKGADGSLLYIKATLTKQEPFDIIAYARRHTQFPHDSSRNQWFKERQFESYRKLGEWSTMTAFNETLGKLEE
jgi:hypothetical protein